MILLWYEHSHDAPTYGMFNGTKKCLKIDNAFAKRIRIKEQIIYYTEN